MKTAAMSMSYRFGMSQVVIYVIDDVGKEELLGTYLLTPKSHKRVEVILSEPGYYRVVMTDVRGASASQSVLIDQDVPTVSIDAASVDSGCSANPIFSISGRSADDSSGIRYVFLRVKELESDRNWDGRSWLAKGEETEMGTVAQGKKTWDFSVPLSGLDAQEKLSLHVSALAIDRAGHGSELAERTLKWNTRDENAAGDCP